MPTDEEPHEESCDCGRCIRRRVWNVFCRVEAELRDKIREERQAAKLAAKEGGWHSSEINRS